MAEIQSFSFDQNGFNEIKTHPLGRDWPIVYVLENGTDAYVGESTSAFSRSKQHFEDQRRKGLKKIHLVLDEEFNKSATLDLESQLIQYFAADGKLKLQNGNKGLENHNYFDKGRYRAKLETIWSQFQCMLLASRSIKEIENSELFKYSPYKALTEEQIRVSEEIQEGIKIKDQVHIVNGGPGTGKTVLAIYLIKRLLEETEMKDLSIGLVIPMTSLRKSLKDVFSTVTGLSSSMVLGPSEVGGKQFDVLIVDEAHRLRQRKNITNYRSHDETNRRLGLGHEGTELDWVLLSSKHQVLFYDENQSIRPADVHTGRFKDLDAIHHHLTAQIRVKGGEKYVNFINDLLEGKNHLNTRFENFDFQIYDDIEKLVFDIKEKDNKFGLSRMVAGFAWKWVSRGKPDVFDIKIDDVELRWNSTTSGWVNSPNAVNEVGCIHTVQGYDLNYVGIIVGPELTYDPTSDRLVIDRDKYEDRNGWQGIEDPAELERYIINIYKTLMTRGMLGCYMYFVDKKTEKYFKSRLGLVPPKALVLIKSPLTIEMLQIPLVGTAPCGNPILGDENIEEYISVEKLKIHAGFDYFILRAEGDSMNMAGIEDGDLVLCRQQLKADTGDRVVALLGDNVTIKEYGPRENGVRLLLPRSNNNKHTPIVPEEGDSLQGVVQEVLETTLDEPII